MYAYCNAKLVEKCHKKSVQGRRTYFDAKFGKSAFLSYSNNPTSARSEIQSFAFFQCTLLLYISIVKKYIGKKQKHLRLFGP